MSVILVIHPLPVLEIDGGLAIVIPRPDASLLPCRALTPVEAPDTRSLCSILAFRLSPPRVTLPCLTTHGCLAEGGTHDADRVLSSARIEGGDTVYPMAVKRPRFQTMEVPLVVMFRETGRLVMEAVRPLEEAPFPVPVEG